MNWKTLVKKGFNRLGLEVRRHDPYSPYSMHALKVTMQRFQIDLVLDVGANAGQFAVDIRNSGYTGRIVSFEPLMQAHALLQKASSGDPLWEVHPRCALGDREGEVEINIAGNSESSSLLPMLKAHLDAAPQSAYQGRETVPLKTLDTVAGPYLKDARNAFIKIDTQGYEWQVLDGAKETLPHIRGIIMELSLVPLYEGQHLWREVIDRLEGEGFELWACRPMFSDPATGRTLQMDGLFWRKQ